MTDSGLAALRCPSLVSLSLCGCSQITNAGLGALQCPQLNTLNLECTGTEVPEEICSAQEIVSFAYLHP